MRAPHDLARSEADRQWWTVRGPSGESLSVSVAATVTLVRDVSGAAVVSTSYRDLLTIDTRHARAVVLGLRVTGGTGAADWRIVARAGRGARYIVATGTTAAAGTAEPLPSADHVGYQAHELADALIVQGKRNGGADVTLEAVGLVRT